MADSLASQIITAIGGPENVRSLTHCATRLRFELVDASKVDQNSLEHMQGVLGAVPQSGDRFQVVIGGGVATVYENIMHLPEMAGVGGASASDDGQKSNADVKAEARSKARGKGGLAGLLLRVSRRLLPPDPGRAARRFHHHRAGQPAYFAERHSE